MAQSVYTQRPLLGVGPDTRRSGHVTFVPTGSNGTIPYSELKEAHNISSVRRLQGGQYEILLVEPGHFIQNVVPECFHSSSIAYPVVFNGGRSLSGSIVNITVSGSLSNTFDEISVDYWSRMVGG